MRGVGRPEDAPMQKHPFTACLLLLFSGCSLYNEVSISPLLINPMQIERGSDIESMLKKADYLRAIEYTETVDARVRKSATELLTLGKIELVAGRYDDARRHLRLALDLGPFRDTAAQIEWTLSQCEYMTNNFEASLDWAEAATAHGLTVKQWHLDYIRSLSQADVYRFSGLASSQLQMRSTRPDIPRIEVRLNARKTISAVIDSGAVMSIASERLANDLGITRLGDLRGTFFGLLGEPIDVGFGMLNSVTLGDIVVQNVPVAIMPDDKMHFVYAGKREFNIDFLLGANFLKEFRTDLDFPRNTATFTRLTSLDRRPASDQNLFIHGFRPFVRGTVNRKGWFMFMLDTGSEITFLNDSGANPLPLRQLAPRMHSAMLQGLGGARKRGAKVENVELGVDRWAGTYKTVPMYTASEHDTSAGIIGDNFLRNFRVVIDFGRMRVDLIRGGGISQGRLPAMVTAAGGQ